jgi:hypothetical protein
MKKLLIAITTIFLFGYMGSCVGNMPTPAPTNVILYDCFRYIKVEAWNDLDGNGFWDAAEPPLQGVKFSLKGPFAQLTSANYPLSDVDGLLEISIWAPGICSEKDYTISAAPPEFYESTTPNPVSFSLPTADINYEAQFGFRSVSK